MCQFERVKSGYLVFSVRILASFSMSCFKLTWVKAEVYAQSSKHVKLFQFLS